MQRSTIEMTDDLAAASSSRGNATSDERTPRAVVWTAGLAIAGLIGGALYLMAVRGDAMLFDLSALSKYVFCF